MQQPYLLQEWPVATTATSINTDDDSRGKSNLSAVKLIISPWLHWQSKMDLYSFPYTQMQPAKDTTIYTNFICIVHDHVCVCEPDIKQRLALTNPQKLENSHRVFYSAVVELWSRSDNVLHGYTRTCITQTYNLALCGNWGHRAVAQLYLSGRSSTTAAIVGKNGRIHFRVRGERIVYQTPDPLGQNQGRNIPPCRMA